MIYYSDTKINEFWVLLEILILGSPEPEKVAFRKWLYILKKRDKAGILKYGEIY